MHPILNSALVLAIGISAAGCSDDEGLLRTQGRLLKGGEPFIATEEGTSVSITFIPILPGGGMPRENNLYLADVDQETGTFVPDGAQKKGMPPGKYRVALQLKKKRVDLWNGRFDGENSPFVFDVDEDTEEIVIDLDKAPPSNIAQQPVVETDASG